MTQTKRKKLLCHHPAFPRSVEMPRASGCGYGRCRRQSKQSNGRTNQLWTDGNGDCRYFQESITPEEGLRRLGKIIAAAARKRIPEYRVNTVVSKLPEEGGWIKTSAVAKRAGLTRSNAYYWLYCGVDEGKAETKLDDAGWCRLWRRRNVGQAETG